MKKFGGKSYGPVILIKEKYKEDKGLLEHELVHSKQFYVTLGIAGLLYLLLPRVKYAAELAAYRVQLGYASDSYREKAIARFTTFIVSNYNLNVEVNSTMNDLKTKKAKYWLWG